MEIYNKTGELEIRHDRGQDATCRRIGDKTRQEN